jgi:hypothetical protein
MSSCPALAVAAKREEMSSLPCLRGRVREGASSIVVRTAQDTELTPNWAAPSLVHVLK